MNEELKKTITDYYEQVERSADKDEFLTNIHETEESVANTLREAKEVFEDEEDVIQEIQEIDKILGGYVFSDELEEDDPFTESMMEDHEE